MISSRGIPWAGARGFSLPALETDDELAVLHKRLLITPVKLC
jgi:hypothetical protein